jgi:hypothetical protein
MALNRLTVGELIALLMNFDSQRPVVIVSCDGCVMEVAGVIERHPGNGEIAIVDEEHKDSPEKIWGF